MNSKLGSTVAGLCMYMYDTCIYLDLCSIEHHVTCAIATLNASSFDQ